MSIMNAAANQSSSVGMAKIMAHVWVTGRNADFRRRRLRLAADASAILLAGLKALARCFLSPNMFRSEGNGTPEWSSGQSQKRPGRSSRACARSRIESVQN
jgi:hypothetical protein